MKSLQRRFGFLVNDVARQYTQQFDRAAREQLGLSQPQVKLLWVLASHDRPLSQAEIAQRLGLTPMAVATMCDRMAAAGWIERRPSPTDRRVNELHMAPSARQALDRAMAIGDALTGAALAGFSAADRSQLLALLARAREALRSQGRDEEQEAP